jgi:hypothetical protein
MRVHMLKLKVFSLISKFTVKVASFKFVTPILLAVLMVGVLITPLYAQLSPARDLTGTWRSGVSGTYYSMDPSDSTMRMDDITATFKMDITQQGNAISIVFYTYPTSWKTSAAYWDMYGMNGVPPVSGGDILFKGTVSGASFTANEYPASPSTQEHLSGTFTTDIITATLTGLLDTSDTNGIIVLREGSSANVPPMATPAPTPALPTSSNLASVAQVQGITWLSETGLPLNEQSQIGTGTEVQTGNNGVVGFNYPDQGGTLYLGANSDAAWVYLQPQTDSTTGNITYTIMPSPTTGSIPFETGIESAEFGQIAITLPIEIGIGILVLGETLPIALTGAAVVEGTLLLGTGIVYVHEQLSPQEGTFNVRPVQVPQGMIVGAGSDYVVTVSNESTTVQVTEGSVIFVDQYTNSSITIAANQMMTIPAGVQLGFSQPELQSYISAYDASSINQWWTQITPTATPIIVINTTPTTKPENGPSNFLSQPMYLAAIIVMVIIIIAALLASASRKKRANQPGEPRKTRKQRMLQITNENPAIAPAIETSAATSTKPNNTSFCPNCGNQLLNTKGSCPFCNSDLTQWFSNAKK